jgi:hypothetical protein
MVLIESVIRLLHFREVMSQIILENPYQVGFLTHLLLV